MPMVGLLAILGFLGIAYYNGVFQLQLLGLTSELSTLIMYMVGMLVGYGYLMQAVLITIFVAAFAAFKPQMHRFARTIKAEEWAGALQLLIITAIVLPILPRTPVDPWGVVVPYDVWVIVIFITGIGFAGYFFNKYFGAHKGLLATAMVGSFVSSTVVTTHIAHRAGSDKPPSVELLFMGMIVAIATMLARVVLVLLVLTPVQFLYPLVVVPLAMIITIIGIGIFFYLKEHVDIHAEIDPKHEPALKSPFEILPALQFGALFIVVLYAVYWGQELFGNYGVIATTFFSALVDVDAAVVSVVQNLRAGEMNIELVMLVVTIALVVNTMIKAFYVWILSRHIPLTKYVTALTGVASIVGFATYLIL
jgi:uncharacterized membrane protein (DUF4010 family)